MRTKFPQYLVLALGLTACGDSIAPEPLLAGATIINFGDTVDAVNGIATVVDGVPTIVLGNGEIGCGSEEDVSSLSGVNVAISLPSLTQGSHDVTATFYRNVDGDVTSQTVTVGRYNLFELSDDSVEGSPQIVPDTGSGENYAAVGRSTVVRCAN